MASSDEEEIELPDHEEWADHYLGTKRAWRIQLRQLLC